MYGSGPWPSASTSSRTGSPRPPSRLARGVARGKAHPQADRRQPLEDAPRACRRDPRRPRGRPRGRGGAVAGDGVDQPRRRARPRGGDGQRDARHARLAAGAPALDRAEPGRPAPEGREHADPPRRVLQLPGGALLPARRLRPQPGRQAGQDAGHLRASVRRGRLPRGRGGVPRQRLGPVHGGLPDRQGPQALRHRQGRARGRQGDDHHGAHPRGPRARGAGLDPGAEDGRHPQAAEGRPRRRAGPARARGAGARCRGGGHGPGTCPPGG